MKIQIDSKVKLNNFIFFKCLKSFFIMTPFLNDQVLDTPGTFSSTYIYFNAIDS